MKIGIIGLQGAVSEHIGATERAMQKQGIRGEAIWVGRPEQLEGVDGIIIPGGESTTIGKLMFTTGLFERVKQLVARGVPVFGTCAGLIVLAKRGDEQTARTKQPLLGLMDISVVRNAFGRQRESFEAPVLVEGLQEPFPAVFIRAPVIEKVWNGCRPVGWHEGRIIMARQGNILAISFHPELSGDTRIHEMLIRMADRSSP